MDGTTSQIFKAIEEVTLDIKGQGVLRPTEIISDLRIVAETFYGPMKMVGFWDYQKDLILRCLVFQISPFGRDDKS